MRYLKSYTLYERVSKETKIFESIDFDELRQTRLELVNKIKQDCAPFLELSKTCEHPLVFLRGTSEEWLDKNAESIKYMEEDLQKENELLKSLTDCLHITYEELYYSDNGIKKIEDYIGFKSKTKFSKIHKLRNGFIKKSLT